MNSFKLTQIGVVILLVLQIAIFSGCDQYKELTNDPPKISSFTVPSRGQIRRNRHTQSQGV